MRRIFLAAVAIVSLGIAVAYGNYTATQGTGTTFGSIVVSTVNYAQQLICDQTTVVQCLGINSSNEAKTHDASLLAAVNSAIPDCGATPCTNKIGVVYQQSEYPAGATPITASATGTTGATTATLAGTSGKTTYICGYSIRANATAATTVTNTITGVITATLSSIMWVAPLASGLGIDEQIFSPCIPASGTNTGIAIVSGAPGSGGNVSSKGWGYQL